MHRKGVIVGAGALGLGFLAERMADDYHLCIADIGPKEPLLQQLHEHQGYTVNLCSAQGITAQTVQGRFQVANMDDAQQRHTLHQCLQECDVALTATSRSVLPAVIERIAEPLNASSSPTWLLFAENGLGIAEEHAPAFNDRTILVDTVMMRMCRLTAINQEPAFAPIWPDHDHALVVESYDYLPIACPVGENDPFSTAFSLVSMPEFRCWEHTKLYLFNGLHAFISYHAFLQGVEFFPDIPDALLTRARRLIHHEVVPALVKTHPCARRAELEQFGNDLLERFLNPQFNDRIDRGIRGVAQKLTPNERLLGGCHFIRQAGLDPCEYAATINAGKQILAQYGDDI